MANHNNPMQQQLQDKIQNNHFYADAEVVDQEKKDDAKKVMNSKNNDIVFCFSDARNEYTTIATNITATKGDIDIVEEQGTNDTLNQKKKNNDHNREKKISICGGRIIFTRLRIILFFLLLLSIMVLLFFLFRRGAGLTGYKFKSVKYPDCPIPTQEDMDNLGDEICNGGSLNTPECGFDAGDCYRYNWLYPTCDAATPYKVGDGICDEELKIIECGYDDGDCCLEAGPTAVAQSVDKKHLFGDGICHPEFYNPLCLYDRGDCEALFMQYPECPSSDNIINLIIDNDREGQQPIVLGNGKCDQSKATIGAGAFMNEACGWVFGDCATMHVCQQIPLVGDGICHAGLFGTCQHDLGDCKDLHTKYPECPSISSSQLLDDGGQPIVLGNGKCNQHKQMIGAFMNEACGWVFGDCVDEWNTFQDHCEEKGNMDTCLEDTMKVLALYPNCENANPFRIGDKVCDADTTDSPYMTEECGWDEYDCCQAEDPFSLKNGNCDNHGLYNTIECGFDGGDCVDFNAKYPNCNARYASRIGDGKCDDYSEYNTVNCGFDGGDCIDFNTNYPNCKLGGTAWLGDGKCHNYDPYNTEDCGFDGGDCIDFHTKFPNCPVRKAYLPGNPLHVIGDGICHNIALFNTAECGFDGGDCVDFNANYPNCTVEYPGQLGNGICVNAEPYNTIQCGFDGGDCITFNTKYPDCKGGTPSYMGDGSCYNLPRQNNAECGFDGGDCIAFNAKYPNCTVPDGSVGRRGCNNYAPYNTAECGFDGGECIEFNTKYPNCTVRWTNEIENGKCDNIAPHNTAECGFDGGDCVFFNVKYPNCTVEKAYWIGDGFCRNYGLINTIECGFDGGDCIEFNTEYPNCKAKYPSRLGNGHCDNYEAYNTFACGFDGGDCT